MFRRLPILLVIFITTGAHAEQGFLEQLFGSSKNTTTTSEPAVENTGPTVSESEPLALQPTTSPRRYKKRYHPNRRHHQMAPVEQPGARAQAPASKAKPDRPSTAEPPVAREPINSSKPIEEVLPSADANDVLPPAGVWPNPAPQAVAPWPVESPGMDSAQSEPHRDVQAGPYREVPGETQQEMTDEAQQVEREPFLDSQRLVLAGFSAIWLVLGIGMFVFRRQLARAIDAFRRRGRPAEETRSDELAPPLTLILRNATSDGAATEQADYEEHRAGYRRVRALKQCVTISDPSSPYA